MNEKEFSWSSGKKLPLCCTYYYILTYKDKDIITLTDESEDWYVNVNNTHDIFLSRTDFPTLELAKRQVQYIVKVWEGLINGTKEQVSK